MFIRLKAGDFALVIIILAIALASLTILMRSNNSNPIAIVMKDGKVLREINLNDIDKRFEIKEKGKYNYVIVAEHGKIRFEEADCPDTVCVKTGWLSKPGQAAACVPGGYLIKITGESSDIDIMLK